MTTFPPEGNSEVLKRFERYMASGQTCQTLNDGPRIILTGFGIWQNSEISFSGYLLDNMADSNFWPENATRPNPKPNYEMHNGRLGKDEGVRIVKRSFGLKNGQNVNARLMIADVLWDFAGAVLAMEMERFQPDAVIMMGVAANATIEGGATNIASPTKGYYPDGTLDDLNLPLSEGILPDFAVGSTIPMTWDVSKVEGVARPLAEPEVLNFNKIQPEDWILSF